MDLQSETNVEKLQALAYQEIKKVNIAQTNIQLLEQRIAQLQEQEATTQPTTTHQYPQTAKK